MESHIAYAEQKSNKFCQSTVFGSSTTVQITVPIGTVARIRAFSLVPRRLIENQPTSIGLAKIASQVLDELVNSGWNTQNLDDAWLGNSNILDRDALK